MHGPFPDYLAVDIANLPEVLNYGAFGIVLVLLLTGALVPGFFYKKLEKENETLRDALTVERQRNSDLQQFAVTGQKAITALAEVAQEHRVSLETRQNERLPEGDNASASEHGR
jgi:hypothetical protein